jgi:alanine-synthesizing transaminase
MNHGRFSQRTGWNTAHTEYADLVEKRRAAGLPLIDLTASNPTRCGFDYDVETVLGPLRNPAALKYDPDPRGLKRARVAVADYYQDHGIVLDADHVFLTTSTSEAYSFLFRLLCDPGDEVLVAQPSYPLFDFLAAIDDVNLVPYPLFYDYGWHIDSEGLRRQITQRTRAIVLVHPNNPTGHFTKSTERRELEKICAEFGLSLIVDEVFLDYSIRGNDPAPRSFAAGQHPVLTFVLSGISKIAALPQMKVAWFASFGPEPALSVAIDRLEVISDSFLSMNAPAQYALPVWLGARHPIQRQIVTRLNTNLQAANELLGEGSLVSRLIVEAGWYLVLRIPATLTAESIASALLASSGVLIHSGDFFGFREAGWIVSSLLPSESDFIFGINALTQILQPST